jgi:hypothetical protein
MCGLQANNFISAELQAKRVLTRSAAWAMDHREALVLDRLMAWVPDRLAVWGWDHPEPLGRGSALAPLEVSLT